MQVLSYSSLHPSHMSLVTCCLILAQIILRVHFSWSPAHDPSSSLVATFSSPYLLPPSPWSLLRPLSPSSSPAFLSTAQSDSRRIVQWLERGLGCGTCFLQCWGLNLRPHTSSKHSATCLIAALKLSTLCIALWFEEFFGGRVSHYISLSILELIL